MTLSVKMLTDSRIAGLEGRLPRRPRAKRALEGRRGSWPSHALVGSLVVLLLLFATRLSAAPSQIQWHEKSNRLEANLENAELPTVLTNLAAETGWEIFIEPSTTNVVSARFGQVRPAEGLRLLFSGISYVFVTQSNAPPRLLVYRTDSRSATQRIPVMTKRSAIVANEIILRRKAGAKLSAEELAKKAGGKIVGEIAGSGAYRLRFPDAESAAQARALLNSEEDVASTESNFFVGAPPELQPTSGGGMPLPVAPKPVDGAGLIIGLVDMTVQTSGTKADLFMLPQVSVADQPAGDGDGPSHGTAMASLLLQSMSAAEGARNTTAKILPIDVYGANEYTTTFVLANGITEAVNRGANFVNLSLGSTSDSPLLHDIIQSAAKQGIFFFAAAGNEPVATDTFPAAYTEVFAVSAMDSSGKIASDVNHGNFIDLLAPETGIIDFRNQNFFVKGTSASTALASGYFAGLVDVSPLSLSEALRSLRTALSSGESRSLTSITLPGSSNGPPAPPRK